MKRLSFLTILLALIVVSTGCRHRLWGRRGAPCGRSILSAPWSRPPYGAVPGNSTYSPGIPTAPGVVGFGCPSGNCGIVTEPITSEQVMPGTVGSSIPTTPGTVIYSKPIAPEQIPAPELAPPPQYSQ